MVKHRRTNNKISWQGWKNINLTRFKTNPKGAQTIKIGLYFLPWRRIKVKMQYAKKAIKRGNSKKK